MFRLNSKIFNSMKILLLYERKRRTSHHFVFQKRFFPQIKTPIKAATPTPTPKPAGKPNAVNPKIINPQVKLTTFKPNLKKKGEPLDPSYFNKSEHSLKMMKYSFIAMGVSFVVGTGLVVMELGKTPVDEDGTPLEDEYSQLPWWQQYIFRTMKELNYYKRLIKEPSREKLLPDVFTYPYYQPPYTLVLELKDLLVHPEWTYETSWRFKKRPGLDYFLETVSGVFEIVIYTAETGSTVFPLVAAFDPKNLISYHLVRDATHFVDGHHVKNLDRLNRDLSKVIVVDWNEESVKFHRGNMLHIPKWEGNDDDTTLFDLAAFLRTIAQSEIHDVREVLNYYKDFDDPLKTFREKQKHLFEKEEAEKEPKAAPKPQLPAPSFLKHKLKSFQ